ncbi:MAG TPA: histidine phosphatase family protein [Acetomicrobium flavidum]|uniref:histidine phosphatase family protein n=1 Tax=Acetomicrobium flavidum TaxID=49896 RepID=UPI002CEA54DB|nr:histidine phosphatase family protein [Acetomicrobium flavidum]
MRKLRYYLIRHGETTWNAREIFQGKQDAPLSEKGLMQAQLTSNIATKIGKATIWCSSLLRARQTAKPLAERGRYEILIDDGLMEIDHGEWECLHVEEVKRLYPELFNLWLRQPDKVLMPGGESLKDVQGRAVKVLDRIRQRGEGQAIIVTHDAVIKCLLCHWLELPLSGFWRFRLANCSVSIVEEEDGMATVPLLGDICHLESGWRWSKQRSL